MKHFILSLFVFFALNSCVEKKQPQVNKDEVIESFLKDFNLFYNTYAKADIGFIDYYTDDVKTIDTNGNLTEGSEAYREVWTKNFEKYDIDLLEYTQPGIVFSYDQIVSYNDYNELFINKETGDTIRVEGTWIGVWQKVDEQWKVKLNTFHIREQKD